MNVDVCCLGNHELDRNLPKAMELIDQTNAPWLMSNILDKSQGREHIIGLKPYHVMETQGFKIGFIGVAGTDFIEILSGEC